MKANATDLPQPAPVTAPAPAEAVTALYRAHALGLTRLAVVMLGDRAAAGGRPARTLRPGIRPANPPRPWR